MEVYGPVGRWLSRVSGEGSGSAERVRLWGLGLANVRNDPSGTSRASSPSQAPPICHAPCFLPPPRKRDSGPVESNPAGGGMGGAVARPKRRSANPRRHVHGPRPLRSRLPRRARPMVTGGDPAAPGRLPVTPQPPHEPRPSLRFGPRRRVGAPAPLRSGLRLRSLRSLRPGPRRPGARSVRALALAGQGGRVRAVTPSRRNRLHVRRGGRSSSCRPTLPAAPTVPAERRSCPRA